MPNRSGKAYGLTTLCPLEPESGVDQSPEAILRDFLNDLPKDTQSPMAAVPNTYLCRFFILNDVIYQSKPAHVDHLRSKYLVFVAELHGELDAYLQGMWTHAEAFVKKAFEYCVDFKASVSDARSFSRYVQRCQVTTTFYFMGSTDEPLAEQLKALYLKQELSKFVHAHQGLPAAELQREFQKFIERVRPSDPLPAWRAGAASLSNAVVGEP
jgi:hypothetical protein